MGKRKNVEEVMNLTEVPLGEEYIVKEILADDEEMDAFLFTLGCYCGEPITVVSRVKGGCVVSIKDGRYRVWGDASHRVCVTEQGPIKPAQRH